MRQNTYYCCLHSPLFVYLSPPVSSTPVWFSDGNGLSFLHVELPYTFHKADLEVIRFLSFFSFGRVSVFSSFLKYNFARYFVVVVANYFLPSMCYTASFCLFCKFSIDKLVSNLLRGVISVVGIFISKCFQFIHFNFLLKLYHYLESKCFL